MFNKNIIDEIISIMEKEFSTFSESLKGNAKHINFNIGKSIGFSQYEMPINVAITMASEKEIEEDNVGLFLNFDIYPVRTEEGNGWFNVPVFKNKIDFEFDKLYFHLCVETTSGIDICDSAIIQINYSSNAILEVQDFWKRESIKILDPIKVQLEKYK